MKFSPIQDDFLIWGVVACGKYKYLNVPNLFTFF